ncbi:hypothetical protein BDK51DRAFT_51759 [Blyttiomyces helicus]|uniref:Uncharacterized protein n=1 Tax=Blyttiomyces helicus TaxID=388810 RepID=A0A4V1IPH1_9FUNG|nr:hypothetical protein BDK51DRAFT_51759 [Blyttiomyces helicus]|eukprot:RKO83037.1 hypothetical protein BDK51DRAFT_51759 [Blyttiomyces helicus]
MVETCGNRSAESRTEARGLDLADSPTLPPRSPTKMVVLAQDDLTGEAETVLRMTRVDPHDTPTPPATHTCNCTGCPARMCARKKEKLTKQGRADAAPLVAGVISNSVLLGTVALSNFLNLDTIDDQLLKALLAGLSQGVTEVANTYLSPLVGRAFRYLELKFDDPTGGAAGSGQESWWWPAADVGARIEPARKRLCATCQPRIARHARCPYGAPFAPSARGRRLAAERPCPAVRCIDPNYRVLRRVLFAATTVCRGWAAPARAALLRSMSLLNRTMAGKLVLCGNTASAGNTASELRPGTFPSSSRW